MGLMYSLLSQAFPPKPTFTVDSIPDLTGKVVIVTGANTGVGKETAKRQALLLHNAKVYVAARSQEKAEEAIKELKEQTGKEGIFLKLDLADLASIKKAADEFQSKEKELHILFNNAGVMRAPIDLLTAQNYDLQFGTNVLGHFYFTKLLLPTLLSTAKSSLDGKVRVVTTSSSGHELSYGIDFNTLKDSAARRRKMGWDLYGQSKLGNVLFANKLARRYGDQGIVSTSCNPGNLKSDLQRNLNFFENVMIQPMLYPAPYGALTQLYAGTSPEAANLNGEYLIPWARVGKATEIGRDPKLAEELWKWCEEQVAST
ncbi:NAD(P)-binding protein [Cyathus striatus]|nr:NAD(P)-binding protein [Cyathus striatus]